MKASKQRNIKHIKAGKPFMYQRYSHSKPSSILIAEPYSDTSEENLTYHLKSYYKRKSDGGLCSLESGTIYIKTGGNLSVLLSIGDIMSTVGLQHEKIILLDKNYNPIV